MTKVLLLYTSLSGNTKKITDLIEAQLVNEGIIVIKQNTKQFNLEDINLYKTIIIGSYTWGEGILPSTLHSFYQELDRIDIAQKTFAVFGSGDSSHHLFCAAVDLLENKIKENGGTLIANGLKIELSPSGNDIGKCIQFTDQIIRNLYQS